METNVHDTKLLLCVGFLHFCNFTTHYRNGHPKKHSLVIACVTHAVCTVLAFVTVIFVECLHCVLTSVTLSFVVCVVSFVWFCFVFFLNLLCYWHVFHVLVPLNSYFWCCVVFFNVFFNLVLCLSLFCISLVLFIRYITAFHVALCFLGFLLLCFCLLFICFVVCK